MKHSKQQAAGSRQGRTGWQRVRQRRSSGQRTKTLRLSASCKLLAASFFLAAICLLPAAFQHDAEASCTNTPNLGLCKAARGDADWDLTNNANLDTLDTAVGNSARVFNIQAYGAVPGTSDNRAAIQAAVDAAATANGAVWIPPASSCYRVNGSVLAKSGVTFLGDGYGSCIDIPSAGWTLDPVYATCNAARTCYGIITVLGSGTVSNVRILGVRLRGTKSAGQASTPKLIYAQTVDNLQVHGNHLENSSYEGLFGGGTNTNLRITENYAYDVGYSSGLQALGPGGTGVIFAGNILNHVGSGISHSGTLGTITGNTITDVQIDGIGIGEGPYEGTVIAGNTISVAWNATYARKGINIYDSGLTTGKILVAGNTVKVAGTSSGTNLASGITISDAKHVDLQSNTVEVDQRGLGIYVTGFTGNLNGAQIGIHGNKVRFTNEAGLSYGIRVNTYTGVAATLDSRDNEVSGLSGTYTSPAFDFNTSAGGTIVWTSQGDRATGGIINYPTQGLGPTGPMNAIFTGAGLNDLTAGGGSTAGAANLFTAVVDGTGSPNTFKWKKNSGSFTTGVAMTGAAQTLSDGITVTFGATTGHTLNDQWVIRAPASGWGPSVETASYEHSSHLQAPKIAMLGLQHPTNVVVTSGVLDITGNAGAYSGLKRRTWLYVDGQGYADDDLDTITGGVLGDLLILQAGPEHTAKITAKHATGNLRLSGGTNVQLDPANEDRLVLLYDGVNWLEVARSNLRSPGPIGIGTPNSGAFTTLSSSGVLTNNSSYAGTAKMPTALGGTNSDSSGCTGVVQTSSGTWSCSDTISRTLTLSASPNLTSAPTFTYVTGGATATASSTICAANPDTTTAGTAGFELMASCAIKANTVGSNGRYFKVTAWYSSVNTNSKQAQLYLNTTAGQLLATTTTTSATGFSNVATVMRTGAATQNSSGSNQNFLQGTQSFTADMTIDIYIFTPTEAGDARLKTYFVEMMN